MALENDWNGLNNNWMALENDWFVLDNHWIAMKNDWMVLNNHLIALQNDWIALNNHWIHWKTTSWMVPDSTGEPLVKITACEQLVETTGSELQMKPRDVNHW